MLGQRKFTRYIGVAISILGLAVIALGVFFVTAGLAAKSEVQAAMAEEQVTVTIDEVKVPVTDQATAMAMAETIKGHTLGKYGPWQGMERDGSVRAQGTGKVASSKTSRGVADAMPALPVQVHAKKEGQDLPRLQDLLLPDMQA